MAPQHDRNAATVLIGLAAVVLGVLWLAAEGRVRGMQQRGALLETQIQQAQSQERVAVGLTADLRRAMQLMADPATRELAVRATPPSPTGRVYINPAGGAVQVAQHLSQLPHGRRYELWLLTANGSSQSAGMFDPGADGTAVQSLLKPMSGVVGLAVSIEPAAGSPQPTGMIVLAAKQPAL